MIVGDMDSVSDKALTCGAEIVVHAYRDGRAPGLAHVEELGVEHHVFAATGTSEDIAMLMADEAGAEIIVALGTHATLLEFLDKGRAGMSSTFLTRLKVGGRLIDARPSWDCPAPCGTTSSTFSAHLWVWPRTHPPSNDSRPSERQPLSRSSPRSQP